MQEFRGSKELHLKDIIPDLSHTEPVGFMLKAEVWDLAMSTYGQDPNEQDMADLKRTFGDKYFSYLSCYVRAYAHELDPDGGVDEYDTDEIPEGFDHYSLDPEPVFIDAEACLVGIAARHTDGAAHPKIMIDIFVMDETGEDGKYYSIPPQQLLSIEATDTADINGTLRDYIQGFRDLLAGKVFRDLHTIDERRSMIDDYLEEIKGLISYDFGEFEISLDTSAFYCVPANDMLEIDWHTARIDQERQKERLPVCGQIVGVVLPEYMDNHNEDAFVESVQDFPISGGVPFIVVFNEPREIFQFVPMDSVDSITIVK